MIMRAAAAMRRRELRLTSDPSDHRSNRILAMNAEPLGDDRPIFICRSRLQRSQRPPSTRTPPVRRGHERSLQRLFSCYAFALSHLCFLCPTQMTCVNIKATTTTSGTPSNQRMIGM
jgi:hypothetical protein